MNKKKRWLLPEIIEERISEYDRQDKSSKDDQGSSIDERLKIEMYENENVQYKSTCLRYANNQMIPQIIDKNGHTFNSTTLTRWINFETRDPRPRRHHINTNRSNFGIEQRPGFFPSEVTYTFSYPRRADIPGNNKGGKSSLSYCGNIHDTWRHGRDVTDTNRNRRRQRQRECRLVDTTDDKMIDEQDLWSTICDESGEFNRMIQIFNIDLLSFYVDDFSIPPVNEYPIDYFIPYEMENVSSVVSFDPIYDRKAHKYFESFTTKTETPDDDDDDDLLCSLPCTNQSEFLSIMQQDNQQISQANLSPAIFIQRTSTSSFSVVYSYSPSTSTVDVTLNFTGELPPHLLLPTKDLSLQSLIEYISKKLNEYQIESKVSHSTKHTDVDALRGSLPLPINITANMLLVRPHATDKQTALHREHVLDPSDETQIWFNTIESSDQMDFECSICCEMLTKNEIYRLLPCMY